MLTDLLSLSDTRHGSVGADLHRRHRSVGNGEHEVHAERRSDHRHHGRSHGGDGGGGGRGEPVHLRHEGGGRG